MIAVTEDLNATRRFHESLGEALRAFQYRMQTDDEITGLVRAGNHEAFDALVTRYRDRIYALAIAALGNEQAAGDTVCQALTSAFRDVGSVGPECSTGTWLYLHGLRAVFSRLDKAPGGYAIETRTPAEETDLKVA
jgi:DNA-directed RNA polymerase specialized sigma24 family protein